MSGKLIVGAIDVQKHKVRINLSIEVTLAEGQEMVDRMETVEEAICRAIEASCVDTPVLRPGWLST